jgi:hypothetical protein
LSKNTNMQTGREGVGEGEREGGREGGKKGLTHPDIELPGREALRKMNSIGQSSNPQRREGGREGGREGRKGLTL